jgi:hypothetical protein
MHHSLRVLAVGGVIAVVFATSLTQTSCVDQTGRSGARAL